MEAEEVGGRVKKGGFSRKGRGKEGGGGAGRGEGRVLESLRRGSSHRHRHSQQQLKLCLRNSASQERKTKLLWMSKALVWSLRSWF